MSEVALIAGLLMNIAPKLAQLLSGPLAYIGLNLIAKFFGLPSSDPKAILEHLEQNPDKTVTLAQLESQVNLKQIQDIEDARTANAAKGRGNDLLVDILAGILILAFIIQCFLADYGYIKEISPQQKLGDIVFIIANYLWGASRQNKKKD